jgi:cysteine-rich repeat protein
MLSDHAHGSGRGDRLLPGTLLLLAGVLAACGGGGQSAPPSSLAPVAAVCGDRIVQGGEECDDGNLANGDACLSSCFRPATWVASDPHLHTAGCGAALTQAQLSAILEDQQLELGAVLVWGDGYEDRRFFTGRDDPASRPGRILHYDLEVSHFPAATGGHLLLLGLDSLDFSPSPFNSPGSGVPVVEWARGQGGRVVIGMAHGGFWRDDELPAPGANCCIPWELVVHAARGRLHFMGVENRRIAQPVEPSALRLWSALQNSGFRVALTGASDFPCIHFQMTEHTPRTDVLLDGELTYDRWLDALRRGRTATAKGYGYRLDLRIGSARLGEEVRARVGETLTATIESRSPEAEEAELWVNGAVVARTSLPAGHQVTSLPLSLPASGWVSARTAHVLTSPVYVLVDGRPIRASADDACYLVKTVDHLTDLVSARELDLGGDRPEALAAYAEARTELVRRFQEAGGQECR